MGSGVSVPEAMGVDDATLVQQVAEFHKQNPKRAQQIIEAGLKLGQTSEANEALLQASMLGHIGVVRELLQQGAEVNMQDKNGRTALHRTSENGHTDIVRELLRHGWEVNTQDENGYTALHRASMYGHTDVVRELLQHAQGKEVNTQDVYAYTALHRASMTGHTDIVRELLKHGAEVSTQDEFDRTGLHWAAGYGHTDMVRELLQHGADVSTHDKGGRTALHLASVNGHTDTVRELLRHQAEINTQGKDGCTALQLASEYGNTDTVRELLQHRAEVNTQNVDGRTALHWASMHGHTDIVRELLQHGAEVNTHNADGCTALHLAIQRNYPSILELLLTHGAAADASMLSLAKQRALSKVASLLAKRLGYETEAALLDKGCFYPVFVCTVEAFLILPNLMKYEEACELGYIMTIPVNAVVVFFSHRWLNGSRSKREGGAHPDRDDAYKYNAMKQAIQNDFTDATHVWVDFLCVPQEHPETQLLAINSLPFIVRQCAHFVVLHGISGVMNERGQDEASFEVYNSRGWCRLECLSALAPLEEEIKEIRKWRLHMNTQAVEQQSCIFEKDLSIFNPFGDGSMFYDASDREKISLMVYNLAKRFENDIGIAESAVYFFPEDLKEKYTKEGSI